MKISGETSLYGNSGIFHVHVRQPQLNATSKPNRAKVPDYREEFIRIRSQVVELSKLLEKIDSSRFKSRVLVTEDIAANATSASDLGDLATETAAVMTSTEEVNTTSTSFSTFGPIWTGSTAQATIGGIYDGSNGTMTLTFEVDKGGIHGEDNLKIKVFDPDGNELEEIDIRKSDPIDKQYTLNNGLILTISEGDLLKGTTFTEDVFDSVGSAVDPNKPFNGTRTDNPNLEYGLSVTDGTFQLNGVTIDVYANDTINTVLDQITQSDAGVSATFDAASETVVLTQKTPGSVPTIVLENDTSGFLAAMKLESATPTPGTDGDPEKPLAEVELFSLVQSGTISVNGAAISIDVNVDSLNDVLDRINASGAEVTSSLDHTDQRVTIVSDDPSQELVLDSGETGFFSALEISDGTYHPTQASWGRKGMSQSYAYKIADAFQDIAKALKALFEKPEFGAVPEAFLMHLRQDIQTAISESFVSEESHFKTKFGIEFDFRDTARHIFDFSENERSRLLSALTNKRQVREIGNLFFGTPPQETDGLVERLIATLKQAESDLDMTIGSAGLLLNAWA